jgi:nucleoid DNA-binding protein
MTKADLVDSVASSTGLTKRDVAIVVEALLDAIKEALADHRHIEIREFGTFKVKQRKASMKYNPRDRSQKVVVPAKRVPVFKPSKFLKEKVNWSDRGTHPPERGATSPGGETMPPESAVEHDPMA